MKPLTKRQQVVLDFVCDFAGDRGFSPSLREIGEAMGLANISAVRGHVAALERKGYLKKEPDKPRAISIIQPPSLMSRLKRRLHEYARTDEGVFHQVVYGIILAARRLQPLFHAETREYLDEAIDHLRSEHGWKVKRKRVENDHLVLVVAVWPNHSPDLAASRIRSAIENSFKRHGIGNAQRLWARGYAITTDLDQLDEIERQFLATCS
jgi:hypothetical protein